MEKEATKKKLQVPHVYILLLAIIFICTVLTYLVPAGTYDMQEVDGRTIAVAGTYHQVDSTPVNLMGFLSAVPNGMVESAQIIFFIFIVGGSFGVLQDTGAIEAGLGRLTRAMKGKESLVIPVVMLAFGFGGAIIGMAEETLPFIPIMISLAIGLGFDSIVGTAMVFCGAGCGFAAAFMNPFTIGVAQGIAGLPIFSGMTFRIIMFVVFEAVTITLVTRYAHKVKKNPQLSPMYEIDQAREENTEEAQLHEFGSREKVILLVFVASIALLIFGVIKYGWYMTEISALFLGMSFVVAAIGRMGFNGYAESLGKGMATVASGALIVGFARGILVVLTQGQIIHTILYGAASLLNSLPGAVTAIGMYIFQCLLNFLIPSGSGQAAVSIPIMAPLADMVGVTRQTACLAFQLGDGISNIFTPTSGYFMAGLALAKIPWTKWAKWILPLILTQYAMGAVCVIIAQLTGFGPF